MRSMGRRFRPSTTDPSPIRTGTKKLGPLVKQGNRRIQHLVYQMVFVGDIWHNPEFDQYRKELESAFERAVKDPKLNSVFPQYFDNQAITVKAQRSILLDPGMWMPVFSADDATQQLIQLDADKKLKIIGENKDGYEQELATFFVVGPGTVLNGPDDENTLDDGLHAFHYYSILSGNRKAYYAVAAWGDGSYGISKSDWEPWQNTCAMLYHEFAELITNPDVDSTKPSEKGWFVGKLGDEREIADLSVEYYADPRDAFEKVAVSGGDVPIQLLWSNAAGKPVP